jgi:2-methylcitrate dehydratase
LAEKTEEAAATAGSEQPKIPIAEQLARFAAGLRYEDLPEAVVRAVKRTILDTLGCAIGGYRTAPSRIAVGLASQVTATRGATVICGGMRTSQDLATFANGVMIRNLDFNDAYSTPIGGGHPSDSLAALLSSAEVAGRSGRDLILATAITYEVFCKLSDVLQIKGMGIDQATILGLAALVGSCRLMGLGQEQMLDAIGMTVGGNTALNQGRVGALSDWKFYATAEASRKAIFAAQLAQAGMSGPREIFEGPSGFFQVITRKAIGLPPLGEPFGILRSTIKRFPLGQYAQSVADAALQLRSAGIDPGQIAEINVAISRNAIRVMAGSPAKWQPTTRATADHSIPFALAVLLTYGAIDDQHYDESFLRDPKLLRLVSRVRCFPSESADAREKDFHLCDLEVVLESGARRSVRVEYTRGHWRNPMSDAELEEKFRPLARRQLSAGQTENLLRQLWSLESLPEAAALVRMTRVIQP